MSDERILQAIDSIYDAALSEDHWSAALGNVAQCLHAEQGTLRVLSNDNHQTLKTLGYNRQIPQRAYRDYLDHYIHIDPWFDYCFTNNNTGMFITSEKIPERIFRNMEVYIDYATPMGLHWGIGGRETINEDLSFFMNFNRERSNTAFEQEQLKLLNTLKPHIVRATKINRQIASLSLKNQLLSDAINLTQTPVFIANARGKIIFHNQACNQLIHQQNLITIKQGELIFSDYERHKVFLEYLHRSSRGEHFGGEFSASDIQSGEINHVNVIPYKQENDPWCEVAQQGLSIVIINPASHQKSLNDDLLASLFQFTKAEIRLVKRLLQGKTLNDIADELQLSRNTLRTQLRSCFHKTNTNRQVQLIQLLENL